MQLDEFIQQTLTQIVQGVAKTQQELSKDGHEVNPHGLDFDKDGRAFRVAGGNNPKWASVQIVSFNVAVTASEATEKGGEAGVSVMGIGGGLGKHTETATSSVSRIEFQVPVVLPYELPPKK